LLSVLLRSLLSLLQVVAVDVVFVVVAACGVGGGAGIGLCAFQHYDFTAITLSS